MTTTQGCATCPRRWGPVWVDAWIPNAEWHAISPNGDETGHLCFDCITAALEKKGYQDVPVELWGGPWKQGGHVEPAQFTRWWELLRLPCENFGHAADCKWAGRDIDSPYGATGYCLPCKLRASVAGAA